MIEAWFNVDQIPGDSDGGSRVGSKQLAGSHSLHQFSIFWIFDSQLSKILYSFLTLYNVVSLPVHFSCPCGHPLPGATLRSPFESWEDKQLCGGGWIQGHLWHSACKSKYLKLENPIFHQNAKVVTLPHIQPRDLQQQGMGRDQPFVLHPQRKPEVQSRFKKRFLQKPWSAYYIPGFWVCCSCWRRGGGVSLPGLCVGPSLPPAGGCSSWA